MIAVVTSGHKPDDERIYHKEIQSLLNAGYDVQYFTRSNGGINLSEGTLSHKNFLKNSTSIRQYNYLLIKIISSLDKIKVLHIHEFDLLPLAKHLKKSKKLKIIYDVHDDLRAMWETFSSKRGIIKVIVNKALSIYERIHLKFVDEVIIANKVFYKNYYKEIGLSTTTIENFPGIEHISSKKSFNDNPVIIYQGQLSSDRGIIILIKAFIQLKVHMPGAVLNLLGTPRTNEFKSEMVHLINSSIYKNDIKLLDEVPHSEVWGLLRGSDIGIIPSLRTPRVIMDTPTKLFEYMASSCAIVATDTPSVRYFAEDCSVIVSPNDVNSLVDGILEVGMNKNKFLSYTKEGRKKIKNRYNWQIIEKKLLSLYEKILK